MTSHATALGADQRHRERAVLALCSLQKNLVGWDKWGGVAEALGSVLERRDSTPKTVRESS